MDLSSWRVDQSHQSGEIRPRRCGPSEVGRERRQALSEGPRRVAGRDENGEYGR